MNRIRAARAVRLVARRELNTRLRTRSFVVSTAVLLVLLCGYVALQAFLTGSAGTTAVALTGQAQGIAPQLQAAGERFEIVPVASEEDGKALVRAGDADALVSGSASRLRVTVKSTVDAKLNAVLDAIVQQQVLDAQLSAAHLDPVQVHQTVSAAHVDVAPPLEPQDPQHGQKLVIGLVVAVLLYLSITTYGLLVAQGVVEEKSSRVVELLLSTVRPWPLLLGKVIGLGLVGLVQLGVIAVVGPAVATAAGVLSLPGVAAGAVAWGLVWYLLGFLVYAGLYGAAGSLVSRPEDTQSVVGPVNIALVIGFIGGISLLIRSPDGTATRIVSLIPLLSPVLMPARIATGAAPPWEIATSLVLTLATIVLVAWLGARIHRNGVLRVGRRVKLAEALRR
ncbi:ABC transporter permease [Amycolatopsis sp. PS_44_ISF1]|uniref:ABC transporter permease n=1 Tax=Amycolatopsis sp. PS_44_ISF1 TaxID=2974917 RepID=UPI0028DF59F7|nr:ABC transporter permease [Amycolatopsis sp. PS_44_ISF1]MDT8911205.1 ABC transporter permease [Amycolatopsis sp. PS_44_ISF1]